MRKMTKKNKIVAVCAAAVLTSVGGGVAFAYWSTTGSGTGSGKAATSNGKVVLTAHFAGDVLTPGGKVPVTYTATNASTSSLRVGTIYNVVSTDPSGCLAGDFTILDVVSDTTVPARSTDFAIEGTGSLAFADTALNQDACKGATITLTLTSD